MHVQLYNSVLEGGAGRAVERLFLGLRRLQVDCELIVGEAKDPSRVPELTQLATFAKRTRMPLINYLKKKVGRLHRQWLFAGKEAVLPYFSGYDGWCLPRHLRAVKKPDVINVHWIAGFLHLPEVLPYLAQLAPLVWTLHDINPLTGGWHYTPEQKLVPARLAAVVERNRHSQQRTLEQIPPDRLCFVGPSKWMAREARNSEVGRRFAARVIPNGLDTDVFCPQPRELARRTFGLPENAKVVTFTAQNVSEPRKGFQKLVDAVSRLRDIRGLTLLVVGAGKVEFEGVQVNYVGHLSDDRSIALAYSAADLFVCSSLQDNLPNTVMEALACGTPSVGFDVGGIPDMIRPGVTGALAAAGDSAALAAAMRNLLVNDSARARMADQARRIAVNEYSLECQARAYANLYASVAHAPSIDPTSSAA